MVMREPIQGKKGIFTDIFIFMIVAFVVVLVSVVFIYIGGRVRTDLHDKLDNKTDGTANYSQAIETSFGALNRAYSNLYWISVFLIVGMVLAIMVGSYMITTKPVFFIPYILVSIIAIIVAVGISNAHNDLRANATLGSSFSGFVGANFIMANLPMWVAIIGIAGGIIMFIKLSRGREYEL